MRIEKTEFEELLVIHAARFPDARGSFFELFHQDRYRDLGIRETFVQDNISTSSVRTLRGLHYQIRNPQAKLITVLCGTIFDVAVDLRRNSATFGRCFCRTLTGEGRERSIEQVKIPVGFAHGFCVVSDRATIHYKCSDVYTPEAERTIAWNDPSLNIQWPIEDPIISEKDRLGVAFGDAEYFE